MAPPVSNNNVRSRPVLVPKAVEQAPKPAVQPTETTKADGAWAAKPQQRKAVTAPAAKPASPPPAETVEKAPSEPRDLTSLAQRLELAQSASQVNGVSLAADNYNDICGGAVAVSALIANSTTPEAAKKNAEALRSALNAPGVRENIPPSVDRKALEAAIDRFAAGKPSMDDVFLMQQGAYAIGRRYESNPNTKGLNSPQLAGLIADLKSRGATLGPETRFHMAGGHWVATAGPLELNTLSSTPIEARNRMPSGPKWEGDVGIKADGTVEARTRTLFNTSPSQYDKAHGKKPGGDAGRGWTLSITPVNTSSVANLAPGTKDNYQQLKAQTVALHEGTTPPSTLR